MPNDITVTKNDTPGSERWDVAYTADQAATVTKTMETGGTMLDRDIKVSVTTPAGSVSVPSTIGGTSATPYLDIGTHKLAMTKEVSVTPSVVPGYVASASASNVTVSLLSDVPGRNDSSMTVSGNTVTAPAGFYPAAASKAVGSGSATTPATTITPNAISISVNSSTGVITASNTQKTQSVTPTVSAGYVSSGTAGTITVSAASNTSQLTTQAAQTIYPSTTDQTIASGKYLTGAQTIKAVTLSNLSAGNIKKDVVVKVGDSADDDRIISVTGTYEGSGGTDFIVTISYNSATDMWEPDCTFADVQAAVNAGKTIVATGTNSDEESVDCAWNSSVTPPCLEYYVRDHVADSLDTIIESFYLFSPGGLMLVYSEPFIVPTGTKTLTSKGTHSVSDYANAKVEATDITGGTITPTTTSQTIASAAGLYNITAALTVAGDANLVAANIADGVSIFGVTGSLAFSTIYSGSSAPSSSTGVNGDIYLQV